MEQQFTPDSWTGVLEALTPSRVRGICIDVAKRTLTTDREQVWAIECAPHGMPHWFPLAAEDPRNPLRPGFLAPGPLDPVPYMGYAYSVPTAEGAAVSLALADGRVLEADVNSSSLVLRERVDLDADSQASFTLRKALRLPVRDADPAVFYCKLWAHVASRVPSSGDPIEHAVLTDPLLLLATPRFSPARAVTTVRSGEDWLPAHLAETDPWPDLAAPLVALAASLLAAPRGFTLGEAPPRALERLSLLLTDESGESALRGHPSGETIASLLDLRMAQWGRVPPGGSPSNSTDQ